MSDPVLGPDASLTEVMSTMRAMRRLKPDPVPRQLLEELVEAAVLGPSGSNVQGYTFLIVTDRAQMRALAEPWFACWRFYERIALPADGLSRDRFERMMAACRYQAEHFADTPALIVACYDMSAWQRRVDTNVPGIARGIVGLGAARTARITRNSQRSVARTEAASIYPGVQNLLLAARARGLGAVMTTWHLMLEQEFKAVLNVPRRVKTFALVPVGWPHGRFGPLRRRPAAEAIRWERW